MSNYFRMRKSIIKNIDKKKFRNFANDISIKLSYKLLLSDKIFTNIENSTIDFKIDEQTEHFITKLLNKNICKTNSEALRFLVFLFIIDNKNDTGGLS